MNEWEQCISEWADRNMKLQQQLADAQATVEALQRERDELKELTSVICGHCCEPMAIAANLRPFRRELFCKPPSTPAGGGKDEK